MVLPHDDVGSGPAVVLLHAGVADRSMWAEHLPAIADAGHRAIAMDLPGFGEAIPSGKLAPWSDVLETMDALGVRRAAVVGNSFGGAVALRAAVTAPERVGALMLISAPAPDLEPSTALREAWEAEESALTRGDIDGAVQAVLDAWTLADAPATLRDRVAKMQRRTFELQAGMSDSDSDSDEAPDPLEDDPGALGRLAIPALVTAGGREMRDFQVGAEALVGSLAGARHAVIADAGHLAPLEQPSMFRKLLLDFLSDPAVLKRTHLDEPDQKCPG